MKYFILLILTFNIYAVERLTVVPNNGATMASDFDSRELALENLRSRIVKKEWMKCNWVEDSNELNLSKILEDESVVYCDPSSFSYSINNVDQELAQKAQEKADRQELIDRVKANAQKPVMTNSEMQEAIKLLLERM